MMLGIDSDCDGERKMRQKSNPVTRGFWWLSLVLLLVFSVGSAGCLQTRGAMFLQKQRVGVYLDKTKGVRPPEGVDFTTFLIWRARMSEMPDGNRILGGFCTDKKVLPVLQAIDTLRPTCQRRLYREASSANQQGKLFWGFFSTTLGAGALAIGMGAGALAVTDPDAQKALGVVAAVSGSVALLAALINGLGGFDARQEKYKIRTKRIDNFMWSLRQRVIVEVCNAKNLGTAVQQSVFIYNMTQRYCTSEESGDGTYRIPTGGEKPKFDSKSLPSGAPGKTPPSAKPSAAPANVKEAATREEPKAKPASRKAPSAKPASRKAPSAKPASRKAPSAKPASRKAPSAKPASVSKP